MTDKLAKERREGQLAQQIKDNPIYSHAHELIQKNLREFMEDPKHSDEQTIEAKRMLVVSKRFRKVLETVMDTGKMAERQILDTQKQSKVRQMFGR